MGDRRENVNGPVVTNPDEVARLMRRDVNAVDLAFFRSQLDRVAPYVEERNGALVARIQLAMLFLAQGDRDALVAARKLADIDWRDLLTNAEYRGDSQAIHRWRQAGPGANDGTPAVSPGIPRDDLR